MDGTKEKISIASACRCELAAVTVKSNCCRRAMLGGMMANAVLEGENISFSLDEKEGAEAAALLLRQCCGCRCEPEEGRCASRRIWRLRFTSRRAAAWLLHLRESSALSAALAGGCAGCTVSFLRGLFIAGGRLTDPEKGHHFEVILREPVIADLAEEAMQALGFSPKRVLRPQGTGLYLKESGAVEEALAALGATRTVFTCINAKILREIRNHENRLSNCDAGNIQKSVSATGRQLEAIALLREQGRMDKLDDELRRSAELRAEYPELSLSELGQRMKPPISKSGMYHRMNKIIAAAEAEAEGETAPK